MSIRTTTYSSGKRVGSASGGPLRLLGRMLLAMALLCVHAEIAGALPRFSLLTGTRCSACHFNPQGSGIRNELGWSTMNQVGALQPADIGLEALYEAETNTLWDGLVTVGLDARLQMAKLGRTSDAPRKIIPMQLAPSVAITPFEELAIYGTYNAGPTRYVAQTNYEFAVQYQPEVTLPSIRAGYIQPSFGVRHDDHTMFMRRDAADLGVPVIPPNYNDWGAEINYEGQRWLTVNVGAFSARSLSKKVELAIDSTQPLYLARVMLWPQLLDEGLNGMVGGSFFGNQEFSMMNAFVGIGIADKATIYGEGMYTRTSENRIIRNLMVQGSYQLAQWLALEWRYEWGLTEHVSTGPFYANSFVIGTQFFPLPYLEIRPEYRYFEDDEYGMGQYTLQFHAFY